MENSKVTMQIYYNYFLIVMQRFLNKILLKEAIFIFARNLKITKTA